MHRTVTFLLLSFAANAATYPAASPSRTDVAAAVALASSGDTVTIPSGAANWTTALNIPAGIKILGAGIGNTIITNTGASGMFNANSGTWFQGITFLANGGTHSDWYIEAVGTNIVVKLCRFDASLNGGEARNVIRDTQQAVIPNGVISECEMVDGRVLIESPYFNGMHERWAADTALGTQDTWYIEDCWFEKAFWGQNVIDANYGGSYVARYNVFSNCSPSMHSIQSFNSRACRKVELYGNHFAGGAQPNICSVTTTGVIYSNTASGLTGDKGRIWLATGRAYTAVGDGGKADGHSNWDGNTALANGTGTHTGANDAATLTDSTKSWTVNQFVISGWSRWIYNLTDGSKGQCTANSATTFTATLSGGTDNNWDTGDSYKITDGWPARDQPGRGKDATVWVGYYTSAAPTQASEPIYIWGNTGFSDPQVLLADEGEPQSAQLIQEGRDYIYDVHPSYTPLAYPHPLLGEGGGGGSSGTRAIASGRVTISGKVTISAQ